MASPAPLGRVTRASLARFAYTGDTASRPKREKGTTPDIEDILPACPPHIATTASTASRKRKRTIVGGPKATKAVKVDVKEEQEATTAQDSSSPSSARRARKPARKATDPSTGAEVITAPSDWEELYAVAKAMRQPGGAAANAAVDTMGCERLADPAASPRDQRFHTLVALMLSSQTKDTTNAVAMRRLQTELPPHKPGAPAGLNLENMLAVDPDTLNTLIWAVGFHNNKTKYLKQTAVILRDTWKGDIPDTIEGLVSLPGVGPKMAHLCLSSAWGRTEGIGVDVHVHRITNLWGWHKTSTPEQTRLALQSWLPRDKWREINWLLVGLGQTICAPVGRKCGDCELGLSGMCKAADRAKVMQGRKSREVKVEVKGDDEDDKVVVSKFFKTEETETIVQDVPVSTESPTTKEDDPTPVSRGSRRRGKPS